MINNKRILLRLLKIKCVSPAYFKILLKNPHYKVIDSSLTWHSTKEGFDFWLMAQMDYAYILCTKERNFECFIYYKSLFARLRSDNPYREEVEKHKILLEELRLEYERGKPIL